MVSRDILAERLTRAQQFLQTEEAALLVIAPGANMRYLTGFTDESQERPLLFFVFAEKQPAFLVPELYASQVESHAAFPPSHVWQDSEGPQPALQDLVRGFSGGKVLVDDAMPAKDLLLLQKTLVGARFAPASSLMGRLRMKKSAEELSAMTRAAAIADQAFLAILDQPFSGRTEAEIAKALEEEMLKAGADEVAFKLVVGSGPNSALPHYRAGRRKIEPGDVIVLDFGCKVNGYCSDTTRTVVCGQPSQELQRVFDVVREAQERAVEAVRPDIPAEEVDKMARKIIKEAGYGNYFIHRTGHGIGLEVHEPPYIVEGNRQQLAEAMTFSVEPGIYLPGRFGVRIEDIVVVTGSGVRRLNNSTHALQVVA